MYIRLREIMKERGMTSVVLSEKIGVSKVTVSNLINNKTTPSLETLDRIADVLEVPLWHLFTSPDEVSGSGSCLKCPHCGKPIHVSFE